MPPIDGLQRHLPERLDVVSEQQGPAPHARSRQRGFGAGMTAADDNDVESGWEQHVFTGKNVRSAQSGMIPQVAVRR